MINMKGKKCVKFKPCNLILNDSKILKTIFENREGLRYKTIMNLCGLKQSTVYKRLSILRKKGLVYNEFPLWKIVNGQVGFCRTLLKSNNIFELHNVGYIIKLPRVPKWWKTRKNKLIRLREYQFKSVNWGKNNSNPYIQLKNDKFVIQTYPESIIVIHRKRYYSNNPYETAIQFLQDFHDLWEWFEKRMRFKFFIDGMPQMTLRGHDFNRINDWVANKIKEEGSKFLVELDKNRKVWVDLSEPFGKEANYPSGQETLEKVTRDHLINKPLLNSELQNLIGEIAQIQKVEIENKAEYSRDLVEHKNAIKRMSHSTEANSKSIELLANIILDLKNEIKLLKK